MTTTPPPSGRSPESENDVTSRPLAVFKEPKGADPDPTTALADVLFGERASRTVERGGERASRTDAGRGAVGERSVVVGSVDDETVDEDLSSRPTEPVPTIRQGGGPAQAQQHETAELFGEWGRPLTSEPVTDDTSEPEPVVSTHVDVSEDAVVSDEDRLSRHANSPGENLRSPQEYPQGYPQADRVSGCDNPQPDPQISGSYPQAGGSYPQESASYPQAEADGAIPTAQGYPQDVADGSTGAVTPDVDPDSPAVSHAGSHPRDDMSRNVDWVHDDDRFDEQEQRVLERIQARQRAQRLAEQRQVGSQPDDPATSRLRPRRAASASAEPRLSTESQHSETDRQPEPPASAQPPSRPNPFADAEQRARQQDEARRAAAEHAKAEPSTGSVGRQRRSAAPEMGRTSSGPRRFTGPQPGAQPPVESPMVPQSPVGPPSGQYPVVPQPVGPPSGQHAPVESSTGQQPVVGPPSGQYPVVPQPPVSPPSGQQPVVQRSAPVARPVQPPPSVDPRLSSRPAGVGQQLMPYTPPAPPTDDRPFRIPKPPKEKDRSAAQELAITEIAGHATFTPTSVTAWYRLPEIRWAFRPDAEREALISAIAEQYAGMAGYRLHLRRTTRPFAADEWARTVDMNTPAPLPAVPGANTWGDHLVLAQRHLHGVQHSEGQTYLGISFARRTLTDTLGEKFGRWFNRGTRSTERSRIDRMAEQFDEVLGAFGVRARRATSHELEWLIFRSVALGMEPPELLSGVGGDWGPGDVLALTEQIERYRTPYGSTVKLVNRLTGEERHVAVLTVGRMEDLEIPERHEPWLHFHERAPWPMELSSRVDVLGPGEAFRNLEHRLRMIRSQQNDYDEHAMDAPPELERLAQRALVVGDEMTTGLATDAARTHGWHRIAVAADTREECLERSRKLMQMYNRDLRISLQHPKNQDWLAREFIPGEPVANTGYLRRMPARLFAAALPQAASNVGDRRGDLIGRTSGTCRRPVFLDLHFPTEVRERSGLAVFVAEPGGGKSTLMGALGYLAARRGVQVTLLDPSGPLARLCEMPELKPYSKVLNLTGSESGTLAPYALIPTPKREHWDPGTEGDREFHIAVSNARAERRMLVQDICSMLVPPQVAREASTARLLRHAARQVPAEETSTLEDIVKCLQEQGDEGGELAALLLDTAEMPLAMLFFGSPPEDMLTDDAMLTVITMAGLRLPDLKIEREYWSAEEALALPMLHTAHRLAVRRSYGGDINRRKMVGLDEAHFMEGWRSGRSFLVRMARDSRKWNLAALVASQNPKDILGLDVQNLVSTVFVGRIAEDAEIAAEALRMLRVPRDVGYEQTLASLSEADVSVDTRLPYREFIMRDVDGRVQRVRADISYVPGLLEHLDTTPGGREAAARPTNTGPPVSDM